ncbi:MAG: ABC transporter substrate-binding protein [Desulfomonile tiedjei]|uniref:ABC transporter substrate-binding protein n=1 Tax=Desulfomonile tiedjei TaxID=2358 RepID=A0A9D6V5N7_9BACT|nr:ABC transporter substrate-binding protein [Desulfomonile tiedjei]
MRIGTKWTVVALSSLVAIAICIATPACVLAEKPIKVGLIDSYTGGAAAFTKPALNGWKMVIEEFNSKGGFKGRKIEIVTRDDKFKPDEALSHARELLLKENVDFLAGTTNSGACLAVSEFAKQKKKLLMVHMARSERITEAKGHQYVFRGSPSADIEGSAGGAFAATTQFKKWYILGEDYEYGHSIADNFWKGLVRNQPGVEKVGEAWPKLQETDYTPYLTAMMAKKPDAVYIAFGASGMVTIMKQAKLFGLTEKVAVFAFSLADSAFPRALKDSMPVDVYGGSNYLWYYPDSPGNKTFVKNYLDFTEKLGEPDPYPSGIGAFSGYCCAKFLIEAILKADSVETEKVVKALEGLAIDTPIGKIVMRGCDHQAETPSFWGKIVKVEGFPFPVVKDVVMTPADKNMPTCAEVMELRKGDK